MICRLVLALVMGFMVAGGHPGAQGGPALQPETGAKGQIIAYGSAPQQFGELRVPAGAGPHAVVVLVHGGCWMNGGDLHLMDALARRLTQDGVATWNIEYRRVGDAGGGWPGTFLDVGRAVDHLRALTADHPLDLRQVVVVGHSSGGHLALWVADRAGLPADSPLRQDSPLPLAGVVSLAGPPELRGLDDLAVQVCGQNVLIPLLGGSQVEVPSHYEDATPTAMLPGPVPTILIHGALDGAVSPDMGLAFVQAARAAGQMVGFTIIQDAGHMDLIDPTRPGWPVIEGSIRSLLERGAPDTEEAR